MIYEKQLEKSLDYSYTAKMFFDQYIVINNKSYKKMNYSNKIIKIDNLTLELNEYETNASEYSSYGYNIYVAWHVKCSLWEYLMPSGTLREQSFRGVNILDRDFIVGWNKNDLLEKFISKLNTKTGLIFRIASKYSLPESVYERFSRKGHNFNNGAISLVIYGNNK